MTNQLVTLDNNSSNDLIAQAMGVKQEHSESVIRRLAINYDGDYEYDNQVVKAPTGQYKLTVDGEIYFSKKVDLQLCLKQIQYTQYTQVEGKGVSHSSVFITDWGDDAPDTRGTFKLNKLTRREVEKLDLTEQELEVQQSIKTNIVLFGLLSGDFNKVVGTKENEDGERVFKYKKEALSHIPVVLYVKGSSFMDMSSFLQDNDTKLASNTISLTTEMFKPGKITMWLIKPSLGDTRTLSTEEFVQSIKDFHEYRNKENERIYKKHQEAAGEQGGGVVIDYEVDPELNDDVPTFKD